MIRVLHVDDDAGFARLTAEYLERMSGRFETVTRGSGVDAVEWLAAEGNDVDCVVSDYALPDVDGLEFLDEVRAEYPDLPFIFFTGRGSETIASDAFAGGADEYIQKRGGADQYELLANRIENAVEQARLRRERKAIQERMELALEETSSLIYEIDPETGQETRHGPFERIWGLAPEAVPTSDAFYERALHPEDRDRLERRQQEAIEDPEVERIEVEYRTNPEHGEVRWLWSTAHVETAPDGHTRRLVGLATDVTERKERERQLREIEAKYRQLVEQNIVGIYLIQDGEFAYVNERLAEIFGESQDDMIGRSPYEWVVETDHDRLRENVRKRLDGETDDLRFTLRGKRADGEEIEFEVHGERVEVGGRPALLGTLRDVTDGA